MKQITFEGLNVIEWYDGLVRGIGKSALRSYLIVLCRWETHAKKKDYALFELDQLGQEDFNNLLAKDYASMLTERWQEFESIYLQFLSRYSRPALVLHEEPKIGRAYSVDELDLVHLPSLKNYDLGQIVI